MLNLQMIMEFLKVKETFEIPQKLMEHLFDENKKQALCDFILGKNEDKNNDFLRDMFQISLAERSELKQDYTPNCICEIVSKLLPQNTRTITDICSGTGALTISVLDKCENIICEELSKMSIPMLLLNLVLRNKSATVINKDVLSQEIFSVYQLKQGKKYSDIIDRQVEQRLADVVISNPPYSLTAEIKRDERFEGYEMPPKSKADLAFVLDGLSRLSEKGEAFYILPHGVLFRGAAEEKIRKQLLTNNLIDCIIGLPSNLFLNTQIPVFIMVLKKNRTTKNVLFINAEKLCFKNGKQNDMSKDDIAKIIEVYNQRKTVPKFSKVVDFSEITENGFNLNIPRYVDSYEAEPVPDLNETIQEIIMLEEEIRKQEKEIVLFVKQLQGTTAETEQQYLESTAPLMAYIENPNKNYESDYCKMLEDFADVMNTNPTIDEKLLNISSLERAKKDKIYSQGSILIQVSATKGQLVYLENPQAVDGRYAVFSDIKINPKYLYILLKNEIQEFLSKYQTGLNINPEIFKFFKIKYHPDIGTQEKIVGMFNFLESIEHCEKNTMEKWKDFKKYHLAKMFPEHQQGLSKSRTISKQEPKVKKPTYDGQLSLWE